MKLCERLFQFSILAVAAVLVAGCDKTVRPISNSGYAEPPAALGGAPPPAALHATPFAYRGELSEFDVLGITRGAVASDAEIERALDSAKRVRLHPGSSIMLIQSGAIFPDGPMVTELSKHFRVVAFSGVPPASRADEPGPFERSDAETFSRSLRLAAARGGNDVILCYWGVLESENAKLATKTVSWVPVVNWVLPDEREHVRIRLKLALIDVRTGDWAVLSPEPVEDSAVSRSPRRNVADQKLVESLKERAYTAGAKELIRQYSELAAAE
jgi:hypothetical protein